MRTFIFIFICITVIYSCKNNSADKKHEPVDMTDQLTNMNRIMVGNESKRIDEFISTHNFKTQMTGTGLRYEIYEHGKGEHPSIHDEAEIKYKIYRIDGRLCYSSDSTGPLKFRLGTGEEVKGLEEGLMLMVPGDKAHLVMPAHLAYGMSGDQKRIPPASSLYYDVELIKVVK